MKRAKSLVQKHFNPEEYFVSIEWSNINNFDVISTASFKDFKLSYVNDLMQLVNEYNELVDRMPDMSPRLFLSTYRKIDKMFDKIELCVELMNKAIVISRKANERAA